MVVSISTEELIYKIIRRVIMCGVCDKSQQDNTLIRRLNTREKDKHMNTRTNTTNKWMDFLREYGMITAGTLLLTVGVYFFKYPNNFSTGGVTGIAVVLNGIFPGLTRGMIVTVINVFLLIVGYFIVGKEFGIKTVYSSLLMTFSLDLLEKVYTMSAPFTSEPVLELLFAIFLPAVGSSLLFSTGASTGGTDIVAMIIKKYSNMNISKALMCSDFFIVVACSFVYGIETGLFSFVGLAAKVFVVNSVIEGIYTSKYFTIITAKEHEKPIMDFITVTLKRGATVNESFAGGFSGEPRIVVLTVLNRSEARRLKAFVKATDPHAFNIITNTSEIIGKGFRECM